MTKPPRDQIPEPVAIFRPTKLATLKELVEGARTVEGGDVTRLLELASLALFACAFDDDSPKSEDERLSRKWAVSSFAWALERAKNGWDNGIPLEDWLGWKRPKGWRNRAREGQVRPRIFISVMLRRARGEAVPDVFRNVATEFHVSAKTVERWFYEDEKKLGPPPKPRMKNPTRRSSSKRRAS